MALRLATTNRVGGANIGNRNESGQADENWNGAHIFHKSCLQQWIRCTALDPVKSNVTCPRCRVQFYDKSALNAVRYKLFSLGADEEPSDDVYEVKSFLKRSETFLVSSEDEFECVRKSVKKQLRFDSFVTGFRQKQKAGDDRADPYDIEKNIDDYRASGDQESFVDDGYDAKIDRLLKVMKRDRLLVFQNEDLIEKNELKKTSASICWTSNKTCKEFKVLDADDSSDSDPECDNDALSYMTSTTNIFQ